MAEVESSILHTGKQLQSLEKLHFRTVIAYRYRCRTQARFDGLKPAHTSTTLLSCTNGVFSICRNVVNEDEAR